MGGPDTQWAEWLKTAAYMVFAGIGGFLGYVTRTVNDKQPVVWLRCLLEFAAAGFVGLLVMWGCQSMHLSMQVTAICTGVCGWLGAAASIQVLQQFVWQKLGISRRLEDENSFRQ